MARTINRLTARRVLSLSEPGYHADGAGLYLQVSPSGAKSWIFRFTLRGRPREMGLGPLSLIGLADARERRDTCRRHLLDGRDPIEVRKEERVTAITDTFGECASAYVEAHSASWKNAKHKAQWTATLDTHAASLKSRQVSSISTDHVLEVLEPIWREKTETATRVRQRIEAVLDWATARRMRVGENPARWRGHLDKLLPPPTRLKKVEHRRALPYVEAAAFMQELRARSSLSARALELMVLTATRPNEACGARWAEVDVDAAVWTIPPSRMKSSREHRVPLSPAAVEMLTGMARQSEFIFPGVDEHIGLTTAAPLKVLQEMRPGLHQHGFRSSFRDWAADCTNYPREVAEQALAHVLRDKVEAAYRRTDLFVKRRAMMNDWADFLASGASVPE